MWYESNYTLKTDLVESGLERHQFTKFGDDDTIAYAARFVKAVDAFAGAG